MSMTDHSLTSVRFTGRAYRFSFPIVLILLFVLSAGASAESSPLRNHPSFAEIAGPLKDAVVTIATAAPASEDEAATASKPDQKDDETQPFEEFFDEFFDRSPDGVPQHITSVGSGFVVDPQGLIVTNNHVIEGGGDVYVTFNDGSRLKVDKIVGRDVKTDLTLLKVTPKEGQVLRAVSFGDSNAMRVGDWVMAVGNPYGLGGTVTVGILSATGRDINSGPYDDFLQTDAAINRGNSGGPLFNSRGEVIGVNTAIISPTGGSIGLGFAVPSNVAKKVVEQLRLHGETRRGWIGVHIQSVNDDLIKTLGLEKPEGALVASVSDGGPADLGGLREGDVIVSFDGVRVRSSRQLPRLVANSDVDAEVDVEVLRNGVKKTLRVKIGRLDESSLPGVAKATKQEGPDLPERKPMKGVTVAPLTDELRVTYSIAPSVEGVVVTHIDRAEALPGLSAGDVILEAAHQKIRTPEDLETRLDSLKSLERKTALLTIARPPDRITFVDVELD